MTNDTKKIVARLALVSLLTGGAIFESKNVSKYNKIDESLKEVVEVFEEDTKLDEAADENIAVYENMSIIEAADLLEEAIDITDLLKDVDFSEIENLDKLSDDEYKFAETLTKEDAFLLLQIIESEKEESLENEKAKLKAIKMLDHLNKVKENWIEENGEKIALDTLSWAIKSSAGEEFGLNENEIDSIEIPKLKKVQDMDFYLLYNDSKIFVSGSSDMFNAFYYYYQIKSNNDLQGYENKIYKEALDSAKILTMTGVNTKNYKLTNIRTLKEAKKILRKE